ncbi:D-cysteine desulfhydrase family protein [Candidatus Bipolaricaulota bacterium]|nr:D-cysteine desulfhydrase family protein [Candidatus Bipolaricaulota bacterium]
MQIGKLPRKRIAALPTPLHELKRLSKELDGPRIFIKRDDLTGLAFGGNKARKLEFILGDAIEKGADTVLTTGALQSNHVRMTAAAATQFGLRAVLFLRGKEPVTYKANLLLDRLLGAQIEFVDTDDREEIVQRVETAAEQLKQEGSNPYVIAGGGSTPVGCTGYYVALTEVLTQVNEMGIHIDHLLLASGGGGTHAGVVLGATALNFALNVIGISVSQSTDYVVERVCRLAEETACNLGHRLKFLPADIEVHDQYVGPGYAIPTPEGLAAIRLVAQTEGILLDPVYTGKAMAGLIDLIAQQRFQRDETVLFLHTGGTPALFTDETLWNR